MSQQQQEEDEKKIIDVLEDAHNRGKVCLTRPEIEKSAKIPRGRVNTALASLNPKRITGSEEHLVTTIYYLKRRVKIIEEK